LLTHYICSTCGTQYPASDRPPDACAICRDERQYVGLNGQQWTTLDAIRLGHRNDFIALESNLTAILTQPEFAIHQRAILVESPQGNVLWDCISLLDDATTEAIRNRGDLKAIAISHPHYYTTMVEWSRAFGNIPVYLHSADRQHVVRPDPCLRFWDGHAMQLNSELTLIRCGGHFEGGTVLHCPAAAEGRGALLSGDIIQVVPDRRWVSFMYSYPNLIPLNAAKVRAILAAVDPFEFDRVYGAFHPMQVMSDGKAAVRRSADRYLIAIGAETS
jgi:glyoxylase-like metal-dependent hydrolase (beta-lactamase superfamily II)